MIALAGDFLGNPETPISTSSTAPATRIQTFNTIWNSFLFKTGPHAHIADEIPKLMDAIDKEGVAAKAGGPSNTAQHAYEGDVGTNLLQDFARITSNPAKTYPTPAAERGSAGFSRDFLFGTSRFTALAKTNWDHFRVDTRAQQAYMAAHSAACDKAIAAKTAARSSGSPSSMSSPGGGNPLTLWHQALAMNAWADHFLSDMFAAGE